jgi:predicted ATPase/DNA-binding SARP family transcriptional activator
MVALPSRHSNNLPVLASSFIGRERESSDVKRLVASTRLLTLTGPGGCGKTRLAIAVADSLLKSSRFEHGAWFVDLAGLDAPILIPQVVATTLRVPEAHDRPLSETLADFLQDKKLLLILDNCEHLLAACAAWVQRMLDACSHLHIVATSREPLNLPGEIVWLVPSLALPDPQQSLSVKQLAKSEAIQLFVARARAALPSFRLAEENAATVERICRRLDGIPLAIELAAARVKVLDIGQIAARLDDSLQILTRGSHAAAPRHQTMRAALDWSYHLLLPREQLLFRRLAVFAGGFTLEAAEAVCADKSSVSRQTEQSDIVRISDVLDLLSDLVDKSLVLIAEREPDEAVRYRLLEPIRLYALDQLREAGAEPAMRDRHLAYFVGIAEQVEPKIKSDSQMLWLHRLDKEHDNLRAALAWSIQDASQATAGLRLAKALHQFWQRRGYWSEGRRWLEGAIAYYDAHRESHFPIGDLYLARAIVAEGWLAYAQGDYGGTRERLERGVVLAQASDDPVTMAYALGLQAQLTSYAGNVADGLLLSEAAIASARRSDEHWALAWTDLIHGMILYRRDEAAAHVVLDESERLFRKTGDKRLIATHLNVLGYITANAGDLTTARDLFEEALAIGNELNDTDLQIKESINLAHLARLQGDTVHAAELYERVLAQARELGLKEVIVGSLSGLGHIRIDQGDLDTASQLLHEGLLLAQEIGRQSSVVMALAGLGRIAAAQKKPIPAARVLGAIDAVLTAASLRHDADEKAELESDMAVVRAATTPDEFEEGFAAGHGLTLEQAVQEVLSLERETGVDVQLFIPTPPALRLCALGPARVLQGEQVLTAWPFAKVKELLFYLASHPARTKAQIGLALWPDVSRKQLRNSLGITLYHLRRALGDPHWIIFEDELYRFNRALDYSFDVEVFEAHLAQASRVQAQTPDRAIVLVQEAIALYQSDFVEDLLEGEWFLLRREDLRRKYLDALVSLGQLLFTQKEYARAAESYRRALEKDEVLEEAHRELMRCYARLGERGQALRHYQTFEQIMQAELGSSPALESVTLYERLKRGEEI